MVGKTRSTFRQYSIVPEIIFLHFGDSALVSSSSYL